MSAERLTSNYAALLGAVAHRSPLRSEPVAAAEHDGADDYIAGS